ncbi:MAG TPA: SUMF1/EgtB/PvdO family nonheme iron enzyme [Xanthobacteraceae bacterium]|nr:SUMF1/EgtB/PvdO family nonheme iron enzyme [Xanthobacteraceae bacterium]
MLLSSSLMLVAATISVPVAIFAVALKPDSPAAALHPLVPVIAELQPGTLRHRAAGEFSRNGKLATAPVVTVAIKRTLAVMRHQVTVADYLRCVEAGACPLVDRDGVVPDLPMVGVSWRDAHAYASWLSRETGEHFRLPTDEEWAYAAAGRLHDDALPEALGVDDPGQRALAIYDRDANRQEKFDPTPRPIGSFGANENGLLDVAGNVWEWTDTCYARNTFDARDQVVTTIVNCGVRVVEGRHRTYMADFIRDARAGGCSIGTPPSNLGFRLVRDDDPPRRVQRLLSAWSRRLIALGV